MDCWGSFQVPGPLDLDCELDNDWNTIQLEEVQRRARAGLCGFLDRLCPVQSGSQREESQVGDTDRLHLGESDFVMAGSFFGAAWTGGLCGTSSALDETCIGVTLCMGWSTQLLRGSESSWSGHSDFGLGKNKKKTKTKTKEPKLEEVLTRSSGTKRKIKEL